MIIRPWEPKDVPALIPMIQDSLHEGVLRGDAIDDTRRNAEVMAQLGLHQAQTGQPTLCAVSGVGSGIMGYVMWCWAALPMDLRWRTCLAGNSYVLPEFRHAGVANELRQEARRRCQAAGIERILGPVHMTNARGIEEFVKQGAWPTAIQMEVIV